MKASVDTLLLSLSPALSLEDVKSVPSLTTVLHERHDHFFFHCPEEQTDSKVERDSPEAIQLSENKLHWNSKAVTS